MGQICETSYNNSSRKNSKIEDGGAAKQSSNLLYKD